jgi:hypothetical protein
MLRPLPLIVAFVLSFGLTGTLAILSSFGHGADHSYGAPIPVGTGAVDLIWGSSGPVTFSQPLFALDVIVTAALLLYAGRRLTAGVFLAAVWASLAMLLAVAMVASKIGYVGLPIPAPDRGELPVPESVIVWVDMMIWAIVGCAVVRRIDRKPPSLRRAVPREGS